MILPPRVGDCRIDELQEKIDRSSPAPGRNK